MCYLVKSRFLFHEVKVVEAVILCTFVINQSLTRVSPYAK